MLAPIVALVLVAAPSKPILTTRAPGEPPQVLNIDLGQTSTLTLHDPVVSVSVDAPEVVELRRLDGALALWGRSTGKAHVTFRTRSGDEVRLKIYVTSRHTLHAWR